MEPKNLVGMVLAITVSIICIGAVMMPVLSSATETEKTFDNTADSLWQVEELDTESSYTFVWDHTAPTVATVNGEEVSLANGTIICASDTFLIRYGVDGNGYYLQSVPGTTFSMTVYSAGSNAGDVTITAESGVLTATIIKGSTTTTPSVSFTKGYGIVADGDYVMKSPTQSAYMLKDSVIFAMGLTAINGVWYNLFQIEGNVDGVEISQIYPEGAYTFSNVSINADAVNNYVDLYSLDSITFLATNAEDSTITSNCTYNFFIVPAEVTAELSSHLTAAEIALVLVLPVLMIVAVLMIAVNRIRYD